MVDLPCRDGDGYDAAEARALLGALVGATRAELEGGEGAGGRATAVVAFSGGVDSSLALHLCAEALGRDRARGVTGVSPSLSAEQRGRAAAVAAHVGVRHEEVETREGEADGYVRNDGEACLFCKRELYAALRAVAGAAAGGGVVLVNGTNADDLRDPSRLGLVAAREFRVASPLAQLTKSSVRAAARAAGLPGWDWSASPCLRSRLGSGVRATEGNLALVEAAEAAVRARLGLPAAESFRVRVPTEGAAWVALEAGRLGALPEGGADRRAISDGLLALGFSSVSFGVFRSGELAGVAELLEEGGKGGPSALAAEGASAGVPGGSVLGD